MKTRLPIGNRMARAAATLLVMLAMAMAVRAQTPFAIYCDGNKTFYFTYRNEVLTENGNFTPEGATDALAITALWSGTAVTASGSAPGWNYNSTVKSNTKTVVFESSFASVQPTSMAYWFSDFSALEKVKGTNNLDTSEATDMSFMFFWCRNLSTLDVSGFKTGKVTDMEYMFQQCENLKTLDVGGFDTKNVTNMVYMFQNCSGLTALDVSEFNTGKVTDMSCMFYGCSGLTALDVSGFNTWKVTDMSYMFFGCSGLTALDVSGFNTGKVTDMSYMFFGCSGLTTLDVSGFNTGKVTSMSSMFNGCLNLETLDLSGFDTGKVTDMSFMFCSCEKLVSIFIGDWWNTGTVTNSNRMFYGCESIVGEDGTNYISSATNKDKAHADEGGYMRKAIEEEVTLHDGQVNADIIADIVAGATPGMSYQVTIEERTIYADGYWNTICLPFNVSLNTGALTGFRARSLEDAAIEGNTLTLTFGKEVARLIAGTPYIIKATDEYYEYLEDGFDWDNFDWSYNPYEEVTNPRFKVSSFTTTPSELTFADGAVGFIGNFDPVYLDKDDKTVLFMGGENTLYYPNADMTIGSFRAYFKLNDGYTMGEPDSNINSIVLNFDGETNGIEETYSIENGILKIENEAGVWYDLSGRKLSGKPTAKGIYINNGKKIVIK